MPSPPYRVGSYTGPPGTYSSAMNMYCPVVSSMTSYRRTTLGCTSFFMMAISRCSPVSAPVPPRARPRPNLRRSDRRLMHFSAHSRLVCVLRQSFTLPNAPWPRSLMTTYWFRCTLPLASARRWSVLVSLKSPMLKLPSRSASTEVIGREGYHKIPRPGRFFSPVRVVWDNHQASPDRTAMSWRQPLANGDSAGPNGRILARYYRIARILRPSAGRVTRRARARDSEDR